MASSGFCFSQPMAVPMWGVPTWNHAAAGIMNDTPQWHALTTEEGAQRLASDLRRGLSDEGAAARRARFGRNALSEAPAPALWKRFLGQFRELVVWILVGAAIISGALGEWLDAGAILAIVLLNGILGFIQEERAQRALAALRKLSSPFPKVIREGRAVTIPAPELVPGDLIELEAGDHVPADARLFQAFSFRVQEAALTGESLPVDKTAQAVLRESTPLADRRNMVYLGTAAAAGKATALVVATGMQTELGRIAGLLERYEPEPTPLQRRLAELGRVLLWVCLGIVTVIFLLQLARGGDLLEMFLVAVSLAVAAVPEGLPAVVTLVLALGLHRMVRRNALIRKLPSVETLGSVTVICSDKTGTLTRNEMTIQKIVAGCHTYTVTGSGYSPQGEFLEDGRTVSPQCEPDLVLTLTAGVLCNHARLVRREDDRWDVIGDPTEGALVVAAEKAGLSWETQGRVLHEIPFDSERKAMSVVVEDPSGQAFMYTKGAPEVILSMCSRERRDGTDVVLDPARRRSILVTGATLAAEALRTLALAYKRVDGLPGEPTEEALVFLGLVGMKDPPREEAKQAVGRCHEAGIRPVMITGDHPATALAVARELQIAREGDQAVSGQELDGWSDEELTRRVDQIPVYARVTAEHKLRVIAALKNRGQVVAMTGDGINDAPAVKAADIGIAMGITGTDVTKEAADMVLTDDNFASIVNAVEEGRTILDNIQKFIHYLLATNAGEVLFLFVAALVGWPVPLLALQILWINLVTDGLPALALGMEPPEPDIMRRQPRPPGERVVSLRRGILILLHGALIAAVVVLSFALAYQGDEAHLDRARTVAFCTAAFAQLFFVFGCRSQRYTMPELGPFSNLYLFGAIALSTLLQFGVVTLPFMQPVFGVTYPRTWEWGLILLLALTPVTIIEVVKLLRVWLRSRAEID